MKVIITGATGQIGAQALSICLKDPAITHIYTLTRRPLDRTSPKLTSIIHTDFKSYPDALLSQLTGASACIWSLGTIPRKGDGTLASYTDADVEMTSAAAAAFAEKLAPDAERGRFRFVYVSAFGAERDAGKLKSLWFVPGPRISKVCSPTSSDPD
jgi:NAD(P)H-binding